MTNISHHDITGIVTDIRDPYPHGDSWEAYTTFHVKPDQPESHGHQVFYYGPNPAPDGVDIHMGYRVSFTCTVDFFQCPYFSEGHYKWIRVTNFENHGRSTT